jgi:hypothetical protein
MYVILAALVALVLVIALTWFLILRRLDEGNFEVGRSLHPDDQANVRPWSAARRREREEHATTSARSDHAKGRSISRSWGG